MKSKKNQRLLALILSMVLMLSASISAMAEGDVQTEASGTEVTQNQAEEQSLEEETVPETEVTTEEAGIDTQSAEISEEPVQETTEQETTEASGEATEPVQEATGESTETEVPTTEETTGEETQSVEGQPEEMTTAEEQPEETSEETLPEEEVVSEAAELKQEFTDENGNVTQTITAYVPEGAFQATADQISMEVTLLNTDDTDYIKGMMEELIPENNYLDGYVLYQIDFKVNGKIAKPAKAITITMTGNELAVEDTQKAHVFYYDSEDPEVEGDKDQLVEVIQKDQLIKSLEESGQSTENIEGYDYSEIAVNEGNADTIIVKGWESTIYGCYVEKESVQEVTYEDDTVKVTVSADEKGIIPNKTTLQVVPISNNGDTKDQYKEVKKKLQEKAEKDEYEIAGFLAYDISFVDKDGNEVEPNGEVRVSIEYKQATLPEGMTEEEAKEAEVSMIHLEEDENGKVKEVVDMAEKDQIEAIATTESQQVEKVEVKTESFSTFTITWIQTGEDSFGSFATDIHIVSAGTNGYYALNTNSLDNVKINSEGTPPTLYIDTISDSGKNNVLYHIVSNNTDYYFTQAFVAQKSGNNTYTLIHTESIEAIQALELNKVRYRLQDSGEYTTLLEDEVIIFVYSSNRATTNAEYYTEDGSKLNNDVYNYINVETNGEAGINVKGQVPTGANQTVSTGYGSNRKTYNYAYTRIIKGGQELEPNYMRYYDGKLQYSMSGDGVDASERIWVDVGIAEIHLIYISNDTVETVDTSGIVDIGLFDWHVDTSNSLHFQNKNSGSVWNKWTGHTKTGDGHWIYNNGKREWEEYSYRNFAVQGIVADTLYLDRNTETSASENYTGYPKLAVGDGSVLDYLFTDDADKAYTGLNHLFRLDNEGYYYYNSADNYAYFNPKNDNKNFTVYADSVAKGTADNLGDFMPFDDKDENIKNDKGNFYFSMNVGFNFTQPTDGEINNKPMVFSFSGDDDVWVFIDGKLVLDIGGIHDAISGTIDFSTGKAVVQTGTKTGNAQYDGGLNYALATDGDMIQNTVVDFKDIFGQSNLNENGTFEAGTTHRLEFFYLERGAGESNCSLRFNLQPQASQTITVAKEITNTDKAQYSDVEFDFKLYLEDNAGTGTYHVIPEGTTYTIKEGNIEVGTGTVGANGIFKLKHGQSAVFSNISSKLKYKVEEVSVSSDKFNQVTVSEKDVEYKDQNGDPITTGEDDLIEGGKDYIASTQELLVGEVGQVTFFNHCSGKNKKELKITKRMEANAPTDDVYTFKVSLENTNGELVPYNGEYYLVDDEDNYYTYVDDKLVIDPKKGTCEKIEDGIISRIPANYKIVITDIMSDTEFKVEEILTDEQKDIYKDPTIQTEKCGAPQNGGTGVILLDEEFAQVTVTNGYKMQINVNKKWAPTNPTTGSIYVGLYEIVDNTTTPVSDQTVELNNSNGWSGSFVSNLDPAKQYTVKELKATDGSGDFIIDSSSYIGINEGESISFDGKQYHVDYETDTDKGKTSITITNSKVWQIIKISGSDSGNQLKLEGAEFTLKGVDEEIKDTIYYGKSQNETGIVQWYIDSSYSHPFNGLIPDGTYELEETKAPLGYVKNDEVWRVNFADGVPTISDSKGQQVSADEEKTDIDIYYFKNKAAFDLPSAGGPGIFLYMIGGTLLLMAGSLMIYINRRKGVLKK